MICSKCGAEIKEGCLFCPECGNEVVVVPDEDVLEDDYLKAILMNKQMPEDESDEKEDHQKKLDKRKLKLFRGIFLSLVVFGIVFANIPLYKKVQDRLDKVTLATRETLNGIRVIRAFRKESDEIREFNEKNKIYTWCRRCFQGKELGGKYESSCTKSFIFKGYCR